MVVHPESTLPAILECWSKQPAALLMATLNENNLGQAMVRIRQVTSVPVILIVAATCEDTQIALYEAGADLVLTRPYSTRLLLAQARNLVYRGNNLPLNHLPQLQMGAHRIDPTARTIQVGAAPTVSLTQREFQLLYLFYTHPGQTLTMEQIIEAIWGLTGQGDKNLLRSLLNRLRRKMGPSPEGSLHIQSVAGVGYKWVTPCS